MNRRNRCEPRITRRSALGRGAGMAGLAVLASGNFRPLLAAPQSRWFKIGACEFCLGRPNPSSFEIARKIGLDGLQVDLGQNPESPQLLDPKVQRAYVAAAQKTGLEIASLSMAIMNQVPLKSDPRAARWLADSVNICQALGVTVCMPACFGAGDLDMNNTAEIDHLVKVVKEVAAKAEKAGVIIGLENYLSAEDNMRIIQRIGSPAVKVYYDVGNSTDKGRDVLREIRLLGDLICEFHAKDGKHMLGQGRIDFKEVRKAVDDIGYRGWFQIEAVAPHGVVPDYRAHCQYLKAIFPPDAS